MITFDVEGLNTIDDKLDKWIQKVSNPKELLSELGKREVKRAKQRFKDKTSPDGKRWQAWDRDTQEERIREGSAANGLLVDSGALMNSIDYEVIHNQLYIGSNVDYAHHIQNGTQHMPARPFVGFNQQTIDDATWLISTVFDK